MTDKTKILLLILLFVMLAMAGLDLYVPSIPSITHNLGTTATHTKLTITYFMLGLSIAPLFLGPLSDRIGRRPVLLVSALIAMMGSVFALFSTTIDQLIVARFIQSVGFGGAIAVSRIVASDLFDGQSLARVAGLFSLCVSFGPAFAPILGGYLHHHFGWRSVFVFLSGAMLLLSFGLYRYLYETRAEQRADALNIRTMLTNYRYLFGQAPFLGNLIASSLAIASIVVYASLSPFILQNIYGMSAVHFGWAMAAVAAMSMVGRYVNVVLLRHFSTTQTLIVGLVLMGVGSMAMWILSIMTVHSVWAVILPAMLVIHGTGLVPSNAMVNVMSVYKKHVASVSALYGSLSMFGVFLATGLASVLANTPFVLASILNVMSLLALFGIVWAIRAGASARAADVV